MAEDSHLSQGVGPVHHKVLRGVGRLLSDDQTACLLEADTSHVHYLCKLLALSEQSNLFRSNLITTQNSYVNSSTSICMGLAYFFWGWVSDYVARKQWLQPTISRKAFQSFALFGSAFFLAMVPVAGCDVLLVIILLNLSMITMGAAAGGENLIIVDIAPDFAGSIYGLTNSIASFPGFLAPLTTGLMLDAAAAAGQDPMTQWNILFWVGASLYTLGGFVFLFGVDTKEEKWGRAAASTGTQEVNEDDCNNNNIEIRNERKVNEANN